MSIPTLRTRWAVAWIAVLALGACRCPPLEPSFATPLQTLETYQAQLCRDEPTGEYACFAASLQAQLQGYENYLVARRWLENETPFYALYLMKRADLAERVIETRLSQDGRAASILLDVPGQPVEVLFERETVARVEFEDGSPTAARQDAPLPGLMTRSRGRLWVTFDVPFLDDERLPQVRELSIRERWGIAGIAGLELTPETATP